MGKKKPWVKKSKTTKTSGVLNSQEPPNYDKRPPIFSLEKLQDGKYNANHLDQKHKAGFFNAMNLRKSFTWNQIMKEPRHGLGTEQIPRNQIRAGIPDFITDDVEYFLAFRYYKKHPMVGYRLKDVFFVMWFDHNFTLYNHKH